MHLSSQSFDRVAGGYTAEALDPILCRGNEQLVQNVCASANEFQLEPVYFVGRQGGCLDKAA